jgi:hypothetical protein
MDTETVKFILTIWGAGLSTLLGLITILKFRRESQIKLLVISTIEVPFSQIQISAVNDGSKPATITHFSIGFGSSPNLLTELYKKSINPEKKLSDSDRWTTTIDKEEIITSLKHLNITQKPFHRLWASVQLSNGKIFWDYVYINPKIIAKEYYDKAEQFIATDLFLGFEQMDSEFYPIGIK